MNLHGICAAARQCMCVCGASPGQPCTCHPDGVHLARIARAYFHGQDISHDDWVSVLSDGIVEQYTTVVIDPEVAR